MNVQKWTISPKNTSWNYNIPAFWKMFHFYSYKSNRNPLFKFLSPFIENQAQHGDGHSLGLSHNLLFYLLLRRKGMILETTFPQPACCFTLCLGIYTSNIGTRQLNAKPPTADRNRPGSRLDARVLFSATHLEVQYWHSVFQMWKPRTGMVK